ncbi:MAG: DUF3800 domain-containing protein [Rhodospirillaceae bacterium]|nr:DUF3800 domain-containing protein [Rhodospirillaceae bacterium]
MTDFSDLIVYADESGDHGLVTTDPQYPVFALVFCVMRKADYVTSVVPGFQRFKFSMWGHDGVVLSAARPSIAKTTSAHSSASSETDA